jgi:hypothetical protein
MAAFMWQPHTSPGAGSGAVQNNGWLFTDVVGRQSGSAQLHRLQLTGRGRGFRRAQRRTGLFHVRGGVITEVATEGTVLPGGWALSNISATNLRSCLAATWFQARATGAHQAYVQLHPLEQRDDHAGTALDRPTRSHWRRLSMTRLATTDNRWLSTLQTGCFQHHHRLRLD